MTEPATPRVTRRRSLPLIWIVPLLALAIAGWMLAKQFRNRGPEIQIAFANGSGIEAGKTLLVHKGVTIGTVDNVDLEPDFTGVIVRVRLTKSAAPLARAGSEFWVVHPEFSFSGIHGLETLVTGVRLQVRPGNGAPTRRFRGLDHPPPIDDPAAGRSFLLRTNSLGSLTPGAPVYYRDVKVGIVETTRLADDATAAVARIRIYNPYVNLVRTNSEFWNSSGVSFKVGLSGVEFRASTLRSVLAGGVSFATPDGPLAPPALENTEYFLHDEPGKDWEAWRPQIPIHPIESAPATPQRDAGSDLARTLTGSSGAGAAATGE